MKSSKVPQRKIPEKQVSPNPLIVYSNEILNAVSSEAKENESGSFCNFEDLPGMMMFFLNAVIEAHHDGYKCGQAKHRPLDIDTVYRPGFEMLCRLKVLHQAVGANVNHFLSNMRGVVLTQLVSFGLPGYQLKAAKDMIKKSMLDGQEDLQKRIADRFNAWCIADGFSAHDVFGNKEFDGDCS